MVMARYAVWVVPMSAWLVSQHMRAGRNVNTNAVHFSSCSYPRPAMWRAVLVFSGHHAAGLEPGDRSL